MRISFHICLNKIINLALRLKKEWMNKNILIGCFLMVLNSVFGQFEPKHTFNVELGIPVPMGNAVFKGMMKGGVAIFPYYQYRMKNSLAFGLGAQYTYFQINNTKVSSVKSAKGGVHSAGLFVKVSKEKFHTEQFATDFGVKLGYGQTYFNTNYNDSIYGKPLQVGSFTVAPTLGLILSVDEFSSYRFTIGYNVQSYGFSPQRLGDPSNGGYDSSDFNKVTHFLLVGFGFTHYFHSKTF